ncbi:MAG: HMA2 domain-containing protein [Methylococcus sp.]
MSQIVSSLPGRIRVRAPALRRQSHAQHVKAALARLDGVTRVESNPNASCIVIHFDPARVVIEEFDTLVEKTIDDALAKPLTIGRRPTRMQVNRYAKVGMLGSLATSMALAASGQKRWHAITGAVFLGCLGVHLGVHRRHLLR